MKVHDCEQNTPEWDELRAGRITASVACKLLTPTGKPSKRYREDIGRIVAESRGLQEPEFTKPSYWMERGSEMEAEARAMFQVMTGSTVYLCGFISTGEHVGFSPDGFLHCPEDGTQGEWTVIPLELKCPKPSTHIMYCIDKVLPKEHTAQCHFAMAVTGAPYMWFASYSPCLEPLIIKVERSEHTELMGKAIEKFVSELTEAKERFV